MKNFSLLSALLKIGDSLLLALVLFILFLSLCTIPAATTNAPKGWTNSFALTTNAPAHWTNRFSLPTNAPKGWTNSYLLTTNAPRWVISGGGGTNGLLAGLLSYYNFDAASGNLADSTGHGHTMTPDTTGGTYSQAGIINSSVLFSGDGFSTAGPVLTTTFTINAWIKSADSSDSYNTIYTTEGPGDSSGIALAVHSGYLFYYLAGADVSEGSGTIFVSDGTWHVVTLVNDSSDTSLFVDGVLDMDFGLVGATYTPGTTADGVGAYTPDSGLGGTAMNGSLDELGVWSRSLTSDQITALYNSGSGLPFNSFGT